MQHKEAKAALEEHAIIVVLLAFACLVTPSNMEPGRTGESLHAVRKEGKEKERKHMDGDLHVRLFPRSSDTNWGGGHQAPRRH